MTTLTDGGEVRLWCGSFEKRFTLTSDQRAILQDTPDSHTDRKYVLVAGPPGSGKTTVLVCKGVQWLQEGCDVLVCSVHPASVPPSRYLHAVLDEAQKNYAVQAKGRPKGHAEWGQVRYCDYVIPDEDAVTSCVDYVTSFKEPDYPMNILFDYLQPEEVPLCKLTLSFLKQLKARLPDSKMWAADWFSTVPEGFLEHTLHEPVRYTEQVLEHLKVPVQALEMQGRLPAGYGYSQGNWQSRSGPDVIHLRHKGTGSDDKWPINSYVCGQKVAKVLQRIGVGPSDSMFSHSYPDDSSKGDDHYQYRDVMVVTRNQVKGGEWPAFARGLQAAGIPTFVFGDGDHRVTYKEQLSDVILAPDDKVLVVNSDHVTGMDRRVVVSLTGVSQDDTWEVTTEEDQQIRTNNYPAGTITVAGGAVTGALTLTMDEGEQRLFRQKLEHAHRSEAEVTHRLTMWTRCSRQLIVVHLPEKVQGPRAFRIGRERGRKCAIL